jgi:uncharacterized protein YdiU (UPF0061 family)
MATGQTTTDALGDLDNSFVRELEGMYVPWQADQASSPELLVLNEPLAVELGIDAEVLRTADGVAMLVGNMVPPGASPVAQAYAGHQFGGYSPRLGDGRALLLGEVFDADQRRRDLHLKGSGRTPFARGGDGKAVVGPMLREYLISEAMHALGIPTTRALAVVATGDQVARETWMPGAVLVRVASSHLRVGSFQYAAASDDPMLLRRLADYAIDRHFPDVASGPSPYVALLERVVDAQASLIAQWMAVGFIHGVMNTDNMTISGETIDYGPCAFMDTYDPATVFSSIDHGGRYAFGNQPHIAQWNLARLAESLLPLLADETDTAIELATDLLQSFPERFVGYWRARMLAKLGLLGEPADVAIIDDLLTVLGDGHVDYTSCLRSLSTADVMFDDPSAFVAWRLRWQQALDAEGRDPIVRAAAMDQVNPIYIPRNHLVEETLAAATGGDLQPFDRLLDVLARPFTERSGLDRYAAPAPVEFENYQTFCGT